MKKSIGNQKINHSDAKAIVYDFTVNRYIDENGTLTEKYHKERETGEIKIRDELKEKTPEIVEIVRELYENVVRVHNEDDTNKIINKINEEAFNSEEFRKLWDYINSKSIYTVDFQTQELIQKSIKQIDQKLEVMKIIAETKQGWMRAVIRKMISRKIQLLINKKSPQENLKRKVFLKNIKI
ncbi:hypothetical protein MBGDF03_01209, partial [Thermoplasmatales archaeon SCGC AB-540-F20]